jgi:hypothetical protein
MRKHRVFPSRVSADGSMNVTEIDGAACVTRTRDPRITNAVLYRLS